MSFLLKNKVFPPLWRYTARGLSHDVYVGKPDKNSNIRPIMIERNQVDTKLEVRLKDLQQTTQKWHHQFWDEHNKHYAKSREAFIKKQLKIKHGFKEVSDTKQKLEPEEMAIFHRQFLQENYPVHRRYDREWKKLNRQIIFLMAQVSTQRIFMKLHKPFRRKTKPTNNL